MAVTHIILMVGEIHYAVLAHILEGVVVSLDLLQNMTELIELLEAEGLRDKMIVVCGGPRISHELAKELGFDAGFGSGTYADDVASFVAQEFVKRMNTKK